MFGITFTRTVYRRPTVFRVRHGNRNQAWMDKNDRDDYNGYLIFESKFSNIPIELQDVKEAYECCTSIKNTDLKCSCYQQFGVDGKMAEKYFKKMEKMEETYHINTKMVKKEDTKKKQSKQTRQSRQFYKWFTFGMGTEKEYDDEEDI